MMKFWNSVRLMMNIVEFNSDCRIGGFVNCWRFVVELKVEDEDGS
jgi:hypothetical protein